MPPQTPQAVVSPLAATPNELLEAELIELQRVSQLSDGERVALGRKLHGGVLVL